MTVFLLTGWRFELKSFEGFIVGFLFKSFFATIAYRVFRVRLRLETYLALTLAL